MKGIFLTYGTVTSEKKADDFLKFCKDGGFTDAFIQTDVINKGSRIDNVPDMFPYIVKNKGNLKIHAHITTLRLWREEKKLPLELRPEIKDEWLYLNPDPAVPLFLPNGEKVQRYWCLDSTLPEVQDYLAKRCTDIVKKYDVDGLYIERLYYQTFFGEKEGRKEELTKLLRRIVSECKEIKNIPVSVAAIVFADSINQKILNDSQATSLDTERLQDLPEWEKIVDYIMPMIFGDGENFDDLLNEVKDKPKYIPTLGAYNRSLFETRRQVESVEDYVLFRYGLLSKDNATNEQFLGAVCN